MVKGGEKVVEDDKFEKLKKRGNKLLEEHKRRYGDLRGFRRPLKFLLQNELDGGKEREVTAFEINEYRMPR